MGKERNCVKVLLGMGWLGLLLTGCVSGAGEFQWRFHDQYTLAQKNRRSIADLRAGMSESDVRSLLGEPEMVESLPRETVWYYRTDTTAGLLASVDADFTPLVFNDQKQLKAWGKGLVPGRSYRTPMVGTLP
jgi:outer membrane protein assembly factor BamE (lipoprotein component of BamABCDE complex)